MTLEAALSGASRLRNRVIGRVFRELRLIEQWGSGIARMQSVCEEQGLRQPLFEELGNQFRVTLYYEKVGKPLMEDWELDIINYLLQKNETTPRNAAKIWDVTTRTARSRLMKMVNRGILSEISTSPRDPYKVFILSDQARKITRKR